VSDNSFPVTEQKIISNLATSGVQSKVNLGTAQLNLSNDKKDINYPNNKVSYNGGNAVEQNVSSNLATSGVQSKGNQNSTQLNLSNDKRT